MTIYFLLAYDRTTRRLVRLDEYTDASEATAAYDHAESQTFDDAAVEIVLVGADSLETVKQTHGHYFDASGEPRQPGAGWRSVATGAMTAANATNGSGS